MSKYSAPVRKEAIYKMCWLLLAILLAICSLLTACSGEPSAPSSAPTAATTIPADDCTFQILPGELGTYGTRYTFNSGTDAADEEIQYFVPVGTYEVTNVGKFPGQIATVSAETTIVDGIEEPAAFGAVLIIHPDESVTLTVSDGFYVDVDCSGPVSFRPLPDSE